jgi:hypothetical protein
MGVCLAYGRINFANFQHLMHQTNLVVRCSEFLTATYDVSGSIVGLKWGFFLKEKGSHGDHCLGSLVELRFKVPLGTSYSYITTHLIRTTYLRP